MMTAAANLRGGLHDGLNIRSARNDVFDSQITITLNGIRQTYVNSNEIDKDGAPIYTPKEKKYE